MKKEKKVAVPKLTKEQEEIERVAKSIEYAIPKGISVDTLGRVFTLIIGRIVWNSAKQMAKNSLFGGF